MKIIKRFFIAASASAITILLMHEGYVIHKAYRNLQFIKNGYPLVNGYKYRVLQKGRHGISRDVRFIELGRYLNRAYLNDRYFVGEVIGKAYYPGQPDAERRSSVSTFFIFDTETADYMTELSESEFEAELKKLGLWKEVDLVDRSSNQWLKRKG